MEQAGILSFLGAIVAAIVTLYNLRQMKSLGVAEANNKLSVLQHEIAEAHEKQIEYWKGEYALAAQRERDHSDRIEAQAKKIEHSEAEIKGLKILIAEQAITNSYFLKAVLDNPVIQEELRRSWAQVRDYHGLLPEHVKEWVESDHVWAGPERRTRPREAEGAD